MSIPQRYLIAKYAPNLQRMEPVNIGVVLWVKGRISAKFLPTGDAARLVNDIEIYERWVAHWGKLLAGDAVKIRNREPVLKGDERYMDELLHSQKGNYLLAEGGEVIDKVRARDIAHATDYLFNDLVARPGTPSKERDASAFMNLCNQLIEASGLARQKGFKKGYSVPCNVGGVDVPFSFSYALARSKEKDRPRAVFQRVRVSIPQSSSSAAFMFEHVAGRGIVPKGQCASFVMPDDQNMNETTMRMLGTFSVVVDVTNYREALGIVTEMANSA